MASLHHLAKGFKARLRAMQPLYGTFIKTPTSHATEILGDLGYDFIMIDAEHAAFDRAAIELQVLAARAAEMPALVRVADIGGIQSALDVGAAGVMVPHVLSPDMARHVVAACRHKGGFRGFCNTARAGRYGERGIAQHVLECDEAVSVIGMIEDEQALDAISEIAAVPGLDALFLGRGDLAASLGETNMDSARLQQICQTVAAATKAHGKALSAVATSPEDAGRLQVLGASIFLLASDQGFMRQAAKAALETYRGLKQH